MSKLSELWAEYQSIVHQSANDPCPNVSPKTVPFEWEQEIEKLNSATPPKFTWRIIIMLICFGISALAASGHSTSALQIGTYVIAFIIPSLLLIVSYFKSKSEYVRTINRICYLKNQIKSIEKQNDNINENKQKWESRQKDRDKKINKIVSDAKKLMGSTEKYVSLLTSENTKEFENELLHQYKFTKECNECSPDDFALFRSIDPSRDILVSEHSITIKTNNEVWNTLEQASRRCWAAQLLHHVSNWHLNEGLKRLCKQLMLDSDPVSSTSLTEYLAVQNLRIAETDIEKQLYQMIISTTWGWKCSASKQLIQQILQNRRLREQMVANVKRRLPAPMSILVPPSERLLKMQGRWDKDNDETAAFLNQMNMELCDISKSVHAGDAFYALPMIKNAIECTIPTGSDIRNIAPHAFEEVPYLTCLSIPQNITNINEYIFSSRATPYIIHIYYQGMQSEWNKVSLTNHWSYLPNGGYVIVHCTDTSFVA